MTATALRSVDPAIEEIRDRIDRLPDLSKLDLMRHLPDLSRVDLPSLETLGRSADEAVDRMRGRQRRTAWPWILAGIGVVAIAGVATAFVLQTWSRNRSETWPEDGLEGFDRMSESNSAVDAGTEFAGTGTTITTGLSAAEGSLLSYDPSEGQDV